jgi:hypothetical protein
MDHTDDPGSVTMTGGGHPAACRDMSDRPRIAHPARTIRRVEARRTVRFTRRAAGAGVGRSARPAAVTDSARCPNWEAMMSNAPAMMKSPDQISKATWNMVPVTVSPS